MQQDDVDQKKLQSPMSTRAGRQTLSSHRSWSSSLRCFTVPSLLLNLVWISWHGYVQFVLKVPETVSFSARQMNDFPLFSNATKTEGRGSDATKIIFGHVHMAQTAGTSINRILAAQYERVCGHKGYSYDAETFHQRAFQYPAGIIYSSGKAMNGDSYSLLDRGFHRGRVNWSMMKEIGFHDCDYISLESNWQVWAEEVLSATMIPSQAVLELHIPCRDPLDHFLSQCYHRQVVFDCSSESSPASLERQVESCLMGMNRFDQGLSRLKPQVTLKCYDPIPIDPYLTYMGDRLQPKRFPIRSDDAIFTDSANPHDLQPRNKASECLWKEPKLASRVLSFLQDYDYYFWCGRCMKSESNLLLSRKGPQ